MSSDSTRDIFLALSVLATVKEDRSVSAEPQDNLDQELKHNPAFVMSNVLKNCFDSASLTHIPKGS